MADIHPTALVDENARLADDVSIGPYVTIGPRVVLESGVSVVSHTAIDGDTVVGAGTNIGPFCAIGMFPQHRRDAGTTGRTRIGRNCVIREHVTVHCGTDGGSGLTTIGDDAYLMVGVHVAHDCTVGRNATLANNATLGGHVALGDNVFIGAFGVVHQFVRIGSHVMIGMGTVIVRDVIPYSLAVGDRHSTYLRGLNLVGLKRHGFSRGDIRRLQEVVGRLFDSEESVERGVSAISADCPDFEPAMEIVAFLNAPSRRGLTRPGSGDLED